MSATTIKTADFSPCRQYRYSLFRIWDSTKPYTLFVCLNPSTADETNDDPTVRRCIDYSRRWGYGGFCMSNIFAYRATLPKDMKAHPEPIGADNDEWLKRLARNAGIVVCAWGKNGKHLQRDNTVLEILQPIADLHYLKLTNDGMPYHPLYLPASLMPQRFNTSRSLLKGK